MVLSNSIQFVFFRQTVPNALSKLKTDTQPNWGLLNPQAMVEHLVGSWRISNGKSQARQITPDEQVSCYLKFLYSEEPFEPNVKNPIMPKGEPPPLRKPDLESAKAQLKQEIEDFFVYHKNNPGVQPVHPVFGPLDQEGWLIFQHKHMNHHFRQFGLLDE